MVRPFLNRTEELPPAAECVLRLLVVVAYLYPDEDDDDKQIAATATVVECATMSPTPVSRKDVYYFHAQERHGISLFVQV